MSDQVSAPEVITAPVSGETSAPETVTPESTGGESVNTEATNTEPVKPAYKVIVDGQEVDLEADEAQYISEIEKKDKVAAQKWLQRFQKSYAAESRLQNASLMKKQLDTQQMQIAKVMQGLQANPVINRILNGEQMEAILEEQMMQKLEPHLLQNMTPEQRLQYELEKLKPEYAKLKAERENELKTRQEQEEQNRYVSEQRQHLQSFKEAVTNGIGNNPILTQFSEEGLADVYDGAIGFIRRSIAQTGKAPSPDEIGKHVFGSKSGLSKQFLKHLPIEQMDEFLPKEFIQRYDEYRLAKLKGAQNTPKPAPQASQTVKKPVNAPYQSMERYARDTHGIVL